MADQNSITYSNQYRGDSNLGGGTLGSFQLDTRPLDNLARYTFVANKAAFDQRQKDAEAAAKEIAELTSYDLNSAIPKDREHLQKQFRELIDYVRGDLSVMNYQKNSKGYVDYQDKKNNLLNDIQGATTRTLLYKTREEAAQKSPTAATKQLMLDKLNKEANDTDIRTPLKHDATWDLAAVKTPKMPEREYEVSKIGYNFLREDKWTLPDMGAARNLASGVAMGLNKLMESEGSENPLEREQFQMQAAANKFEPMETAKNINAVLAELKEKHKKGDGTTDWDAAIAGTKGMVRDGLQQVLLVNKRLKEYENLVEQGAFKDQNGNEVRFGVGSGPKKEDFAAINLEDGLDGSEVVLMRMMAESDAAKREVDTKYHGAGTTAQRMAETGRHNRAMEGIAGLRARTAAKLAAKKMAKMDREEDVVGFINDDWKRNLVNNTNLFVGAGTNKVKLNLPHKDNHAFLKMSEDGKTVRQVLPIGAAVTYDRYVMVDDPDKPGRLKKALDENGKPVPAKGAKITSIKGGFYEKRYFKEGKPVAQDDVTSDYKTFKRNYKNAYGKEFNGGLNEYLKLAIGQETYDVEIIGAGGDRVNQDDYRKALMLINNQSKTGKESGVMESGIDYEDQDEIAEDDE